MYMYTNSTMPTKPAYVHTKVDKTSGEQFAALSKPNKNFPRSKF